MPKIAAELKFNALDASQHLKDLSRKQRKKWASIANAVFTSCGDESGKNCEGKAIRIANSKFQSSFNPVISLSSFSNLKKNIRLKKVVVLTADDPDNDGDLEGVTIDPNQYYHPCMEDMNDDQKKVFIDCRMKGGDAETCHWHAIQDTGQEIAEENCDTCDDFAGDDSECRWITTANGNHLCIGGSGSSGGGDHFPHTKQGASNISKETAKGLQGSGIHKDTNPAHIKSKVDKAERAARLKILGKKKIDAIDAMRKNRQKFSNYFDGEEGCDWITTKSGNHVCLGSGADAPYSMAAGKDVAVTKLKKSGKTFDIYSIRGGSPIPDEVKNNLGKGARKVVYDAQTNVWHIPSGNSSEIGHGDFAPDATKDFPEKVHVRGIFDHSSNDLKLYDLGSQSDSIAYYLNERPQKIHDLMNTNLIKAKENVFYLSNSRPKISDITAEKIGAFEESEDVLEMEIFRAGTHNKQRFTEDDLQEMADNFEKLKGEVRPKLKITHRDHQESLAGLASYGDLVSVFVKKVADGSSRLFAKIANIPQQVIDFIKDRRFPERSIEIYPKFQLGTIQDGKTYKNVVKAVALLGHEMPAVSGMEPIMLNEEYESQETVCFGQICFACVDKAIDYVREHADAATLLFEVASIESEINSKLESLRNK